MDNYFKFWRLFPRFFFGALFVALMLFSVIGEKGLSKFTDYFKSLNFQDFGNVFSSLLVIVALLMISSFGLFVLELIVFIIEWMMEFFASLPFIERLADRFGVIELMLPTHQVCLKVFRKNKKEIINNFYLKSWALPEDIMKIKMLKEHTDAVEKHIKEIEKTKLLEDLSYYSAVTQEQAKVNQLRDDLRDIHFFIVVTGLAVIVFLSQGYLAHIWPYIIVGFILLDIVLLPVMKQKKIRLATYILMGYIDIFTLGEGATVVDRESV